MVNFPNMGRDLLNSQTFVNWPSNFCEPNSFGSVLRGGEVIFDVLLNLTNRCFLPPDNQILLILPWIEWSIFCLKNPKKNQNFPSFRAIEGSPKACDDMWTTLKEVLSPVWSPSASLPVHSFSFQIWFTASGHCLGSQLLHCATWIPMGTFFSFWVPNPHWTPNSVGRYPFSPFIP